MDRSLEPLRQVRFAELRAAERELSAAGTRVRALDRQLVGLRQESVELERLGAATTRDADLEAGKLGTELAASRARLDAVSRNVAAAAREAEEVGRLLEALFQRADEVLAALDRAAAEGRQIDAAVDRAWEERATVLRSLEQAREIWTGARDDLDRQFLGFHQVLAETTLLVDSLRNTEPVAFAAWRYLREQGYDVMHYQSQQTGIEVLLRNQDDRLVALQLHREQETGDDILLELDMSGFDAEGEAWECDAELEFLLDELSDVIVIEKRRIEHPHRGPGGEAQRIIPRIGRRKKSSASQARRQKTRT